MTFRNISAVFGLLFLLGIASCKEPEGIGLDVLPSGEQMPIAWVEDFNIEARTVMTDSVLTSGINTYLIGDFGDPIFGRVRSELYTQIRLSSVPFNPGAGQVVDSIVLNLAYAGAYGNTSKLGGTMRFGVYRLNDVLVSSSDTLYYSNSVHDIDPSPLAEFEFRPDLYSDVIAGKDTLRPSLRIKLDNALGQEILNLAGTDALLSNDEFVKKIKGIAVRPIDAIMPQGNGSILYFNLASDASRVELYYKNNEQDSLSVRLNVRNTAAPHMFFEHEYSPEIIDAVTNGYAAGATRLYIQAMAGLKIHLKIPNLRDLNKLGVVAVNKAELLIPLDETVISQYSVPSSLAMTGVDTTGRQTSTNDDEEFYSVDEGYYDAENKQYVIIVTRKIQKVLTNIEEEDLGMYVLGRGFSINAKRGVFNGPQHPTRPMKLRMTYTIIDN